MTSISLDRISDARLSFDDVLQEQCERLHPHPDRFQHRVNEIKTQLSHDLQLAPNHQDTPLDREARGNLVRCAVYQAMHIQSIKSSALPFPGGGIRSTTFNLGVIQALAKLNLLDKFDYLPTVSGGGYTEHGSPPRMTAMPPCCSRQPRKSSISGGPAL